MLKRLLVANRGEIVCRIARTARRLGMTTLAVYSDADRHARHVREADEAFHLGASPAVESYLNIGRIIEVARTAGADAIHPGYGFLSENAEFADACGTAGLTFVGPPPAAMRAMASKSASKAAMANVGVPVAPGYHGSEQDLGRLSAEAERVGFPLIIKASAGGGGKGMQVVSSSADVAAAIESAQRLARTAFGDDRLLLERYFPGARHVEVQIFADSHGSVRALFDRDCSVQRRHQKIIEEAPAPGVRDAVRAAMAEAAVLAARTVGYVGAGTVEFLLDSAQQFYFMEMNTRLQVEHPVTEAITGIDLVEWQLRVASGEPLPTDSPRRARGHAVEVRLYAEDPARDYLPSVGIIRHLRWPTGIRVDGGVDTGDEVSPFYDPMLGKAIAWGESRDAAIDILRNALADFEIAGVTTNRALLMSILSAPAFRSGAVATDFLQLHGARLEFGDPAPNDEDFLVAAVWQATRCTRPDASWLDTRGWRLGAAPATTWVFDGCVVSVEMSGATVYRGGVADREPREILVLDRSADSLIVQIGGRRLQYRVVEHAGRMDIFSAGRQVTVTAIHTEDALRAGDTAEAGSLLTPLPGTVVALHVAVGQAVARGAPLVTVEAMKMEHTLTAPRDGVICRIVYGLEERVPAGAVLVELSEPEP